MTRLAAPFPPSNNKFPLALMQQSAVSRVLVLHQTDRWYFGDFVRHCPWIQWARQCFTQAEVHLVTHRDYGAIFSGDGLVRIHDTDEVDEDFLKQFDLVIEPAAFESEPPRANNQFWLQSWDSGWRLQSQGQTLAVGEKHFLNYFRSADPQSCDADWRGHTRLVVGVEQGSNCTSVLSAVFPNENPIVVYNPTASNEFSRGTELVKEVDNTLGIAHHQAALRKLVDEFPDHNVLVGAAVKHGDTKNRLAIDQLVETCGHPSVASIFQLGQNFTTLQGFSVLLNNERVCSSVGGGTGTNTHLSSLVGTPSYSFERGVDSEMEANWLSSAFQMGSFRWRNPSPDVAIAALRWSELNETSISAALEGFVLHHRHFGLCRRRENEKFSTVDKAASGERWAELVNAAKEFAQLWGVSSDQAFVTAQQAALALPDEYQEHLLDFDDELAWLRVTGIAYSNDLLGDSSIPLDWKLQLFDSSNFCKFLLALGDSNS